MKGFAASASVLALAFACSEDVGNPKNASGPQADGGAEAGDAFNQGEELKIAVPASGRAFAKLASPPAAVTPADAKTDKTWDLAFEGLDAFTNSGPSGAGAASAFGPLDPIVFLEDVAPEVPFMSSDKVGGAFSRWYFYAGAPSHALYSRFHVFGVKDGDKLYRVQVLSYYGERDGTAIPALYRIRYGEVGKPAKEALDLDGTSGGTTPDPNAKAECIDLGTDARTMLTPDEARASSAWHLCFLRQEISVNGGEGGPRAVGAVDFEATLAATEKLEQVSELTPESELGRFDRVTADTFTNQTFRGDGIVSAFTGLWTIPGASPLAPGRNVWLVDGADGKRRYLVGFARFEGATATSPGTIVMRVKPAR
jgi:hypothetical protein